MRRPRGFLTLEILIAVMLATSMLIAITLVALGMPHVLQSAREHRVALAYASAGLERAQALGVSDFGAVAAVASSTEDGYETALIVETLPDGAEKRVASSVVWTDDWGERKSILLPALVGDYQHPPDTACNAVSTGDWARPSVESIHTASPLPPLAGAAAARTRLVAFASTTSATLDPTLFVFPLVSGEVSGAAVGTFDNATSTTDGFAAVAASGTYAYAAFAANKKCSSAAAACSQLQVLDLSDAGHPVQVGSLWLGSAKARSIFYRNNTVYLGLEVDASREEFLIIDVRDRTRPVIVGSAEIGYTVNAVSADGSRVYVATTDNRTNGKALMAFDIAHPSMHLSPIATSFQAGAGYAERLALSGSFLYLGRSALSSSKEFMVFNTNDISTALNANDTSASVEDIGVQGTLAFVLTKTDLELWDVADPNAAKRQASLPLASGESGTGFTCTGSLFYLTSASRSTGSIRVLRSS